MSDGDDRSPRISEETLTGMERDGWTPAQVRLLIASYRQLLLREQKRDAIEDIENRDPERGDP